MGVCCIQSHQKTLWNEWKNRFVQKIFSNKLNCVLFLPIFIVVVVKPKDFCNNLWIQCQLNLLHTATAWCTIPLNPLATNATTDRYKSVCLCAYLFALHLKLEHLRKMYNYRKLHLIVAYFHLRFLFHQVVSCLSSSLTRSLFLHSFFPTNTISLCWMVVDCWLPLKINVL